MATPVISDREREVVKDITDHAMIAGWDRAISWAARQFGLSQIHISLLLDKALKYNDEADPAGRIPGLDDWQKERRGRSERAFSAGRT